MGSCLSREYYCCIDNTYVEHSRHFHVGEYVRIISRDLKGYIAKKMNKDGYYLVKVDGEPPEYYHHIRWNDLERIEETDGKK